MFHRTHIAAAVVTCAALCGCGAPAHQASQVVATVYGDHVTADDLKREEASPGKSAGAADPQLDPMALKRIVDRKLMARSADDQKLDKGEDFQFEAARAMDGAKAAMMARKLIAATPEPSDAQVAKFIAEHPRAFGERKFLVIDQLQVQRAGAQVQSDHAPTTLEEFEALLDRAKIAHERRIDVVDTGAADPKLMERLLSVPPHAIFQVNTPGGVTVNQILETRSAPLTGPAAVQVARNYLRNQAAESNARTYLAGLYKTAGTKIQYSPGYAPPTAP